MIWLIKGPMALCYGLGIVIMMFCALPFIMFGFVVGFIKWSGEIGSKLADRLFFHFQR